MSPPNGDRIENVEQLEEMLSRPTDAVVDMFRRLEGDIVVLGVAGKVGPSLARMVKRASDAAGTKRRVMGVARFSRADEAAKLEAHGIATIRCDLLDPAQLAGLPDAPNVIYMAGMKFGTTGNESLTWAMNSFLPGMVCQRYRRSRIVAYSTGNVYKMASVVSGGSLETDKLEPLGEYSMSCLGRERVIEYFSRTLKIPTALLRLCYASEMRYGVLVDMAQKVLAGHAVDVTMGCLGLIWQGDANAMALLSFEHVAVPPFVVNLIGPETLSVRQLCMEFGRLLGKEPRFTGTEAADAGVAGGQLAHRLFGYPRVTVGQIVRWTADWVKRGGESLGKPTHFETRDGNY
ncbi:MAG: NAD-dependent epimerase/dehydratase family protein [Planctomycetota bacterium]|nr:NAD-dependent epimerase/dehydratase family protein [Planctomycetota bacterium]